VPQLEVRTPGRLAAVAFPVPLREVAGTVVNTYAARPPSGRVGGALQLGDLDFAWTNCPDVAAIRAHIADERALGGCRHKVVRVLARGSRSGREQGPGRILPVAVIALTPDAGGVGVGLSPIRPGTAIRHRRSTAT